MSWTQWTRKHRASRRLSLGAEVSLRVARKSGILPTTQPCFGQNFGSLVRWENSQWVFYVFGLGLLVASVVGFGVFFRRKGWL